MFNLLLERMIMCKRAVESKMGSSHRVVHSWVSHGQVEMVADSSSTALNIVIAHSSNYCSSSSSS